MGRSNIRVVVRSRPTSSFAADCFELDEERASVDLRLPASKPRGHVNNQRESWHFQLDQVLHNASQERVFDCCGRDAVLAALDGYNGTVMAYGQTGAGKTYTMVGGAAGFADRGMVPRAIALLFAEISKRCNDKISVQLSYVEIHNERIRDALATDVSSGQGHVGDLTLFEDAEGCIQVKDLTQHAAASEQEALRVFLQGTASFQAADNVLNKKSSRSHAVFVISLESRSRVLLDEKVVTSRLLLVDLAGSERVKKASADGVLHRDASFINQSLSFLEQVTTALAGRHRDHVPFRQSRLTHLLRDSLGGNCRTTVIANLWPEARMLDESVSTLRFASRMMLVLNCPTANSHADPRVLLRRYEAQIQEMRQELAMQDALGGRDPVQYGEFTPEERQGLERTVRQYLDGESSEIEVVSIRMAREAFSCFRRIHQELREVEETGAGRGNPTHLALPPGGSAAGPSGPDGGPDVAPPGPESEPRGVGEVEGFGLHVGLAPASGRPPGGPQRPQVEKGLEALDAMDMFALLEASRPELQQPGARAFAGAQKAVSRGLPKGSRRGLPGVDAVHAR